MLPVLSASSQDAAETLPPFTLGSVFTEWGIDPIPFVVAVWAVGLYALGVVTLHRRGDRWPVGRTLAFVGLGMGSFVLATLSGLGRYDTTLLSVHMVQHMLLSMVVPLALALGAPVTLALRTLPAAPRRWLLAVLHSRLATVLAFAPLAFVLYVASPWALYFSSWYDASLSSSYVHQMMHIHLVLVGTLFFWPLMGVDPVPGRVSHPFRVLLTLMTLPFHAFLGVTIMGQTRLIGAEHYLALREGPMGAWLPPALEDQHLAGGILWASGDLIGVLFFGVLFTQWLRSSMKEAAREDRKLDLQERRARVTSASGAGPRGHGYDASRD
ncbi:putative copper resistance protein D [Nocardioides cavernae]|uniref:Putative copper resistance protein D n=1 Tax=Nocardioides cavernae TaxID=1921566 RepID=A0A7Y9KUP4_9ACTN|nr:cytochrome c oxidase assembly protein [Nocardioides cavernae]NYE38892.1 putative copper resistance protein D [Nocardioides cavernae]